jgi:hypothetical protein
MRKTTPVTCPALAGSGYALTVPILQAIGKKPINPEYIF